MTKIIGIKQKLFNASKDNIEAYNKNPVICLFCSKSILAVSQKDVIAVLRKRKFCSLTCMYSMKKHRTKEKWNSEILKKCRICHTLINIDGRYTRKTKCGKCREIDLLQNKMKQEVNYRNICNNARHISRFRIKECIVCKYDKIVEIAHIKDVASFPGTALIKEINHPSNLAILCPNHHAELDKHILDLKHLSIIQKESKRLLTF